MQSLVSEIKVVYACWIWQALSCGAEPGSARDGAEKVKSLELPLLGRVKLFAGYTAENRLSKCPSAG